MNKLIQRTNVLKFCFLWLLGSMLAFSAQAETTYHFNFANGSQGWSADFADYPVGSEEFYELSYDFERLPKNLANKRFAVRLSGNNHSDDLCMFMRKKVSGLKPNTFYSVDFSVRIASNAAKGLVGIGGAPGESVYVKAGASLVRPVSDPNTRLLNIDKGNQSVSGDDAMVIGNIAVNLPDGSNQYRFKQLTNDTPFQIKTDESGEVWLFFATDSGFEGVTSIYLIDFAAEFNEAN